MEHCRITPKRIDNMSRINWPFQIFEFEHLYRGGGIKEGVASKVFVEISFSVKSYFLDHEAFWKESD
jgi:hypothetical protein